MFAMWGRFVYARRRWVAILSLALAAVSFLFAGRANSVLTTGGWYEPGSESQRVAEQLQRDFGAGTSLVVLFDAPGRTDAASPAFQAAVAGALAPLRADARVSGIVGYAETGASRFISTDGAATYVVVQLHMTEDAAIDAVPALRAEITPPAGMEVQLTGAAPVSAAVSAQSERDLARAESISLPIALLILLLVFGSLVAAGVPLVVAGLAIPTALAAVWGIGHEVTMSVFVTSVITMLGLALAIDYSLFMVSRFREELRSGATTADAVERTVATSGKAVAFSGSAVALGLSGLLFFHAPTLTSMGIGGALICVVSVAYALTFLPALLGMLGPRVERLRLSVSAPLRRSAAAAAGEGNRGGGWWQRIASGVMARPVAVLVPVLVLLAALGTPFLGVRLGLPGPAILPASVDARAAWETLQARFPAGEAAPIDLLIHVDGDPLSAANTTALAGYAEQVRQVPGVSRVDGPFALTDPRTGAPLQAAQVAALLTAPSAARPAGLDRLLAADVRGSTVHLQAIAPDAGRDAGRDVVRSIRALAPPAGLRVEVGGADAASVDFLAGQDAQMPFAVAFILAAMAVMLFLQFGSLVLPVKAVAMTLLSLTASFGALVWVFQDGNLAGPLGFASPGFTIAIVPILMFSLIFGLSMDYEVLLLSRIQEAYRRGGDNRAAVGEGLARTGRVITGAALIMVSVFAAFGTGDIIIIKSLGVGMAVAVLLDATVIRVLLVPATMRLLGDWNWWAPGPLGTLAGRLGFSHLERDAETVPAIAFSPEPEPEDEAAVA